MRHVPVLSRRMGLQSNDHIGAWSAFAFFASLGVTIVTCPLQPSHRQAPRGSLRRHRMCESIVGGHGAAIDTHGDGGLPDTVVFTNADCSGIGSVRMGVSSNGGGGAPPAARAAAACPQLCRVWWRRSDPPRARTLAPAKGLCATSG